VIASFRLGPIVALNTAITLYRKASAPLQLWNMKVGSILLRMLIYNYEEEEQIKLMYKAVYQLND
jgi:RNA polymerase sigma-70 factor (ECF subfamily)